MAYEEYMTYEEYKKIKAERDAQRKAEREIADREFQELLARMDENIAAIRKSIETLEKRYNN